MDVICSICYDNEPLEITLTSCDHSFHVGCLERWILLSSSCPMCRRLFPTCANSPLTFQSLQGQQTSVVIIPHEQIRSHFSTYQEYYAQFRFGGHARLDFTYPYPGAPIDVATWRIRAQGPAWLPVSWILLFSRRRGHTIEALEAIRRNDATIDFSTVGGVPPPRLFLCRFCRRAIFSSNSARTRHIRENHP